MKVWERDRDETEISVGCHRMWHPTECRLWLVNGLENEGKVREDIPLAADLAVDLSAAFLTFWSSLAAAFALAFEPFWVSLGVSFVALGGIANSFNVYQIKFCL